MTVFGPLGFVSPWLLVGLAALPVLWLLLRAVPPAPIRRRFPGVALLLGLKDEETVADKTPWWLLLLRMLAVAALILGFAGPVLNPDARLPVSGPLLIVVDGTWADAPDWQRRQDRMAAALVEAERDGRNVAVVTLTDPSAAAVEFVAAEVVAQALPGIEPRPWEPTIEDMAAFAAALPEGAFETLWISDGIAREGRDALVAALSARGPVTAFETARTAIALRPAVFEDGAVRVTAVRAASSGAPVAETEIMAGGTDPAGTDRELARAVARFEAGASEAVAEFDLPDELRNRVTRFEVSGLRSAGAVALTDDGLKRREVALIEGSSEREGLELLSPGHYLRQALMPSADVIEGATSDILLADPDVIVLADVAKVAEQAELLTWVEEGGLLVRFAGPRLAASDIGREVEDPLLPVRLRAGGRTVGGAMSWGEPKAIAPFPEDSPFHGLAVPEEVTVQAQVLAEPDPELAERTIAALADGTPLVTAREVGEGRVVLFHVTANAEWSGLPLSGLFVQMLERLAISNRPEAMTPEELKGSVWVPDRLLDAFGTLEGADDMAGVAGEVLAEAEPSAEVPPGLFAGDERRLAINVMSAERTLSPATWPAGIVIEGPAAGRERDIKGILLAAGLALLLVDILAALFVGGRLTGPRVSAKTGMTAVLLIALMLPTGARAQQDSDLTPEELLVLNAGNVVLAYVKTGDVRVDRDAAAGLLGLSDVLFARTSVEPILPIGVDVEADDLSVLTFLYWPVTEGQQAPSPQAYMKLNRYLRSGGMILFDTRDADIAGFGTATPAGRRLQALAAPLDIPPIEPIPQDHVLTRAFYLLQEFPGRFTGQTIWVEAAPTDAEQAEGMPFRNLNDGVTPVVIGGNDWASAWAIDQDGLPMYPVGRGSAGERQREIAYRFGVNLIMHVLTGNYKSDQVHVPALLERLGQ
jgi:hypothetical protein